MPASNPPHRPDTGATVRLAELERAAAVQRALFELADLSFKAASLEHLLREAHAVVGRLMYADNFYVALEHTESEAISFPYFVDTIDPEPGNRIAAVPLAELTHSLSAYLIRHDTTVFLENDADFEQLLREQNLTLVGTKPQCLIGVPLRHGNRWRGAVVVQSYLAEQRYSHDDRDILTFLAAHIGTALERFSEREQLEKLVAERTRSLEQKNRELEQGLAERERDKQLQQTLYRLSQLAHSEEDPDQLYPALHSTLNQHFNASNLYVALISEDGDTIHFPYHVDGTDRLVTSRPIGNGTTEYLLHKGRACILSRDDTLKLVAKGELELSGTAAECWMGAPILIGGNAYGILAVQSYDPAICYNQADLALLGFCADQIAEWLKRQRDANALMLANITLEARVAQRTHELQKINNRLAAEVDERKRAEEMQRTLFSIDELTQKARDLTQLYQQIHELVRRFIHAEYFFVAEYDALTGRLYFPYYVDKDTDLADFTEVSEDDPTPHMPLEVIRKTLTAYVIRTQKPLLADHATQAQLEQRGDIGLVGKRPVDWLGVPLLRDGLVTGVIVVQTYDAKNRYGTRELELLQFVSSHVATALERKHRQEQLEARVAERTQALAHTNQRLQQEIAVRERAEKLQSALFQIAELTNSAQDMDSFYRQLHQIIGQLTYARYFFIALLSGERRDMLSFPYYVDSADHDPTPRPLGNFLTERVIRTGEPLLMTPNNRAQVLQQVQVKGRMPQSWLGVPLQLAGEVMGALVVQSYDDSVKLGENEKGILTFVSQHVATALDRKSARDLLEQRVALRTLELREANLSLEAQIEKRREIEKQLEFDAFHDTLTKLPNRALFMDRLQQIIAKGKRDEQLRYAVLFLDLDRFKVINDSLGHLAGDKLLQQVAIRLGKLVRPQDTVARLGGDEFCVLLDGIQGLAFAEAVARRICDELTHPFRVLDNELVTSTSIGIAYSGLQYKNADQMLRDADAAMYQAKMLGKRQYAVFDQSMHARAMNTVRREAELRRAISQGEIDVYYQPLFNLANRTLVGFEALARWIHPNQGLIPPSEFIPMAEESGLITELDLCIAQKACLQVARWNLRRKQPLSISVNLSSKHFSRRDLVQNVQDILGLSGLEPGCLKLEITESVLMENVVTALQILERLKGLGVMLALDDFGTGYSSLSYLHRFPLDILKIDRCFVDDIDTKKENHAIVNTIITLARALGMTSVAEGIETEAQASAVTELGCDLGQGYLFARPLPLADTETLLANNETA